MKIPVGILGATGIVGQHYLKLLENHPWFEVTFLASSSQSAGKSYAEAVKGRWHMLGPIPQDIDSMLVHNIDEIANAKKNCHLIFSAVDSQTATLFEERYAAEGLPVFSNASYHRSTPDVPILIPEVNPQHAELVRIQQRMRGWQKGFICVKPNCTLQSYMIPLAPLHEKFKVVEMVVTTLQAISGAGYPGVSANEILYNVIPYISQEEIKSELEPLKIWGTVTESYLTPAQNIRISAHCNRVPVIDGHLACVSVRFDRRPSVEEILDCWANFRPLPQQMQLPSAPTKPIIYREEQDRPQPRHDSESGNGMSVTVGRLRECSVCNYRFVALSHNTIRGAAGGGILCAELLYKQGFLEEAK